MRNLAITYGDGGHGDEAEQSFDEYFERARRIVGSDKSSLAEQLAKDAPKLMKYQRFERAERFLREALAIHQQRQAASLTLLKTQSLIGAALLGQHKHAEAEAVLVEVFEGLNRQNDENGPNTVADRRDDLDSTADLLVRLYSEWNKPDEASKWKAKRAKLLGTSPDG